MSNEFILPSALNKGDKVAVMATSAGIKERFPAAFEKGIERLEERFGLEPVIYDTAERDTEYLNANPKEKAEEFMQAFEDPEIKGVIPVSGGDEELRVLKHLDPERLKNNPTRFYGISDNTNLHLYLWNLGIQTFYAGQIVPDLMSGGELGEYTYNHLERVFFEDSLGTVEASDRFTDEFVDIQTDAPINPGNSGGPLINKQGVVVGVNRAKQGDNIGFAISPAIINRVIPSLIENGDYTHPYLGISMRTVSPSVAEANNLREADGVLVVETLERGPAAGELHGSRYTAITENSRIPISGDVIKAINGRSIDSSQELSSYLATQTSPGEKITITILRNQKRKQVQITLGKRPEPRT